MTDSEKELVARLRWLGTDWDENTQLVDGEPVRHWLTAGEARQAADAIERLSAQVVDADRQAARLLDRASKAERERDEARAELSAMRAARDEVSRG